MQIGAGGWYLLPITSRSCWTHLAEVDAPYNGWGVRRTQTLDPGRNLGVMGNEGDALQAADVGMTEDATDQP